MAGVSPHCSHALVVIDIYKIDPVISLVVIVTILIVAIVGSFIKQKAELRTPQPIADVGDHRVARAGERRGHGGVVV